MDNKRHVELLAPAGNPASFYGAVSAGADAVYLAGNRFGARAYAENFTTEELVKCIRYGHLLGRKIYLTVNTLLKEAELEELYDYILPYYESGLDAVILQDFGVLRFLSEHFPGLELHASTQMTLCSSWGAQLLKDMGASRIVPARELSLRELKLIRSSVDIELETFIHGAMCYCYSGQCLFSSILGGRSGNRGRCAQPCRLPYTVKTGERKSREAYYLSLKDMCTVEHIPELTDAGIDSFKIEGRMKKPEYAAGVTAVYRKYIDRYYELLEKYGGTEAAERFRVEQEDSRSLSSLYIRSEIQDGYYFRHNGKEMVTLSSPAYSGSDDRLLERVREKYLSEQKKLPVTMKAVFCRQEKASLTLYCAETSVSVEGDIVETAQKQPVTEENIKKQLGKLGDSVFCVEKMDITVSEKAFYPLKQINELRRQAIQALEEALLADREAKGHGKRLSAERKPSQSRESAGNALKKQREFGVSVETEEQLKALAQWIKLHPGSCPSRIYVAGDLISGEHGNIYDICAGLAGQCSVYIMLPYILRESDRAYLEKLNCMAGDGKVFCGFLIRSADGLGFLRETGKKCRWNLDANVYTWNREALALLAGQTDSFCLPYELKASEQRQLLKSGRQFEKIVYGRIPMMLTANCVLRTSDKCHKNKETESILADRYGKEFPVIRNCRHCMNIIYNSVPLSLYHELSKWEDAVSLRIDFTVENGRETVHVLDAFLTGAGLELSEHTTGHEKRGVE